MSGTRGADVVGRQALLSAAGAVRAAHQAGCTAAVACIKRMHSLPQVPTFPSRLHPPPPSQPWILVGIGPLAVVYYFLQKVWPV